MADFGKAIKYERPAREEAPNPFVEPIKAYTDQGIDTAFPVSFNSDEFAKEKLLIQKAANVHGYSVREVSRDGDPDKDAKVTVTFVVRPKRKSKGENVDASASVDVEATGE